MLHQIILAFASCTLFQSCKSTEGLKTEQRGEPLVSEKLADLSSEIEEASGMAYFAKHYWIINDGKNTPQIHALNSATFSLKKSIQPNGIRNVDWEDLTQDEKYLYILDAGNNHISSRKNFQIHRIPLDDMESANDLGNTRSQSIEFTYGEKNDIDAEALSSVGDELWIFTKNWKTNDTTLYKLDKKNKKQVAQKFAEYKTKGLITAADYNPRTQKMALLGYTANLFGESFVWIVPVKEGALDWVLAKQHPISPHAQWEAVLWNESNGLYIAAEDSPIGNPVLSQLVKAKAVSSKEE